MGKVAIEISGELLRDFITDGSEWHGRVIDGLPEGAEFVRSFFDSWRDTVVLIYMHDSLPEGEAGMPIPRICPTLQKLQYDALVAAAG